MKREYNAPEVVIVKVKTESLLDTISRGEDMSKGSGDSRMTRDWDDED